MALRIAMLNCDSPVPNVVAQRAPTYGAIFHSLLVAAAGRVSPGLRIDSVDFDTVRGEYPSSPADFDVLLITGSASSAYDKVDWALRLDDYVSSVYRDHPEVKIFGSCFGHQIICQSLLRNYGVFVEKDPNGWELGVQDIQLNDRFVDALGLVDSGSRLGLRPAPEDLPTPDNEDAPESSETRTGALSMRLQFIHSDHVNVPQDALPPSWIPVGRSRHCAFQGVYQPSRILTYQGHFEFDRFVNSETVKVFGEKWDPAEVESALVATDQHDDSEPAADLVMSFFLEGKNATGGLRTGGLITPPLKA